MTYLPDGSVSRDYGGGGNRTRVIVPPETTGSRDHGSPLPKPGKPIPDSLSHAARAAEEQEDDRRGGEASPGFGSGEFDTWRDDTGTFRWQRDMMDGR